MNARRLMPTWLFFSLIMSGPMLQADITVWDVAENTEISLGMCRAFSSIKTS